MTRVGAAAAETHDANSAPLAGYTVGITAARRSDELQVLLERRGAWVVSAPAIRIIPLDDDHELLAATRCCSEAAPDVVVATTGIGFRGWMEAADGWGLGEALRASFAGARLIARGPKARGAIRAAGLRERWSPSSEAMGELLDHLLASDITGLRVAVQLHGEPLPKFTAALRAAGATVVEVPVYRWAAPIDERPLSRLVGQIATAQVDSVVFTSAPAVTSLLRCARANGVEAQLLAALGGEVLAACVGPVCAAPLDALGVPTVHPSRGRLGDLVRTVVEQLPGRRPPLIVNDRTLEVRGRGIVLDGEFIEVSRVPLAVLRALATRPGRVLSRRELLTAIGGGDNEHVIEMAVSRLRSMTGDSGLVRTVMQRGYRLSD